MPRPESARNVHVGIFDADGVFRHKKVSGAKAAKLARSGGPFCDVLYCWDTSETPMEGGAFSDLSTSIDADTWRFYPFDGADALCIADFDHPFGARSARQQAARMIEKAREDNRVASRMALDLSEASS